MPEAPRLGQVAELFAGVGGFRLGLEGYPSSRRRSEPVWSVVWSNQWEPGTRVQDASSNYQHHFGPVGHVTEDIALFLDWAIDGEHQAIADDSKKPVPHIDLLVGGFPCQDYSVARPLSQSTGIAGKKGVLWWQINRFLEWKRPKYVLLENVDRLLKSPSTQRGRDFAVMLSCFHRLGYQVQWRVINAAEYGFPQRRRRVFILAELLEEDTLIAPEEACDSLERTGTLARALPVRIETSLESNVISDDPFRISEHFGLGLRVSPWSNAGVMRGGVAYTARVVPVYRGRQKVLGDVLIPDGDVPGNFFIPKEQEPAWSYLKGAKREPRTDKSTGFEYEYAEGGIAYPDPIDRPSRTILTGEGGTSASRFKHVVMGDSGRLRRLVPEELEQLQGFPSGWTSVRHDGKPISDGRRAFFMGNALVVGVVELIGRTLAADRASGASTV